MQIINAVRDVKKHLISSMKLKTLFMLKQNWSNLLIDHGDHFLSKNTKNILVPASQMKIFSGFSVFDDT